MKELLLALALWAAPAAAAEPAPVIAPPPAWVDQVEIPAPDPAQAGKPFELLMINAESRYGEQIEHYAELVSRVQNAQGLQGMGNVILPWQPDQSELIVHKVNIIRDGKTIDLLAGGQTFTVLRRENNLEAAMLDGVLTAVMQPEGLAVGDVLDVAFTIRLKKGALPLKGENFFFLTGDEPVRRIRYRQIWTDASPMRWRGAGAMARPRLTKTRWGNELVLELADAAGPKVPDGAPSRYGLSSALELSGYRDWNEVSRVMAPVYASARTIGADSPLKAEIARIAGAGGDPQKKALAALRLVQDRIRYLALAMGDGGLVPASADQTWTRKFGDCKGKTAILLALLDGLGIEAEPVAISTVYGDGLSEHLPLVRLFNHVIVRARINGRSLWLDGTRNDSRTVEDVSSYPFAFGLPIRAEGAALEALPLVPPSKAMDETEVTFNASAGFDQPVSFSGTKTFRGPVAAMWRVGLSQQSETEMRDALKSSVPGVPDEDIQIGAITTDEEANSVSFTFSGKTRLAWTQVPSSGAIRIKFNNNVIQWSPDLKREDGQGRDTPFALPFPVYYASRETIILPARGAGFRIEGASFDREVAGTRIARTVTLEDGKAVAVSTFRRLRGEISAAEAEAAVPTLAEINADMAYVRSPETYRAEIQGPRAATVEPKTASDFVEHGFELLRAGKPGAAMADFDRAAAMEPAWSQPAAGRGFAFLTQNKLDEAEAAFAKAAVLNESDADVHQGYGMLHLARLDGIEAERSFSRAIELKPDKAESFAGRAAALRLQGRLREAVTALARAKELDPSNGPTIFELARVEAAVGDEAAAIAAIDDALRTSPDDYDYARYRADLLARFGHEEQARQAYDRALAAADAKMKEPGASSTYWTGEKVEMMGLEGRHREAIALASTALAGLTDNVTLLAIRCRARAAASLELQEAARDCDRAIQFDPGDPTAVRARGLLRLRTAQWAGAIADYDKAISMSRHDAEAHYGRGIARLRSGDRQNGERDLGTARRLDPDVEARFKALGIAAEGEAQIDPLPAPA